jgi:hypothetical protein
METRIMCSGKVNLQKKGQSKGKKGLKSSNSNPNEKKDRMFLLWSKGPLFLSVAIVP